MDLSALSRLGFKPAAPQESALSPQIAVEAGFSEKVRGFHLFHDVEGAVLEGILARSSIRSFAADVTVLTEHENCNAEAYVVVNGKVEVSIEGDAFAVLGEGSLFGEYALIAGGERTATVRTLEPTECLVLDEDACLELSSQNGSINEIMLERIEENIEKGRGVFAESAH